MQKHTQNFVNDIQNMQKMQNMQNKDKLQYVASMEKHKAKFARYAIQIAICRICTPHFADVHYFHFF